MNCLARLIAMVAVTLVCLTPHPASALDPGPLTEAVQPFVERVELAGAVMLVADREKVLSVQTAGWADIAGKKPMQPDTLFWIASQSKPITAAAVMILVDEQKIKLDDPVEKYLPEFRGQMFVAEKDDQHRLLKPLSHPITIRNVLSHTSGLSFKSAIEEPTLDLWPLSLRVRSYAAAPLDFAPETKYQYSNAGINTAARIVEVVAHQPFEVFLSERLLKPLGMNETSFWPTPEQEQRVAKAYAPGPDKKGLVETTIAQLKYPLADKQNRFPMPAGGLFAPAADLAAFYQMLLNRGELRGKRVLSEAAVKELTTRQTPAELKDSYGLGFSVSPTTFGHGGAYSTNSTADTQQGLITIWLVQHAGFPGEGQKSEAAFRQAAVKAYGKK